MAYSGAPLLFFFVVRHELVGETWTVTSVLCVLCLALRNAFGFSSMLIWTTLPASSRVSSTSESFSAFWQIFLIAFCQRIQLLPGSEHSISSRLRMCWVFHSFLRVNSRLIRQIGGSMLLMSPWSHIWYSCTICLSHAGGIARNHNLGVN